MKVKKRNGNIVEFQKNKIVIAILKAMRVGNKISKEIATEIADEIEKKYTDLVTISQIEADVFNLLIKHGQQTTARVYEGYRSIREFQRNCDSELEKQLSSMLDGKNEYWSTENSNKDADLVTTKRDYMAGIISKHIAKKSILSPDVIQADKEAVIKVHDLDYMAQHLTNCCLINLEDMLQNGTNINGVHIDKPHRILTASTLSTQIINVVTSSQYGGTTITLTHLAPFVRSSYEGYVKKYKKRGLSNEQVEQFAKEDLHKEVVDAVQTFNYQVNSMSNTNGQSPFVSVFMYLDEDKEYTEEVAMLIEEFLKQRIKGMKNRVGQYMTIAFPKLLYVLDENNIYEDSKYYYLTKLAVECTAKRMVPDYISAKVMKELKGDVYPCIN